ncbi:unnamed protein product [Symbiodinium pilosum]|uniref:Uncharacterized protein n=1 Tax=Symbiodinium pilosum TaxID=2952 RepID=A0A812L5S5_SYMPI|nr:unnamed protein product [Symbiodinium pilosum]
MSQAVPAGKMYSSKRSVPWRQQQKPWAPSVMAGIDLPVAMEAKTALCFRPRGETFSTKGKSALDQPWISNHADTHTRRGVWSPEQTASISACLVALTLRSGESRLANVAL